MVKLKYRSRRRFAEVLVFAVEVVQLPLSCLNICCCVCVGEGEARISNNVLRKVPFSAEAWPKLLWKGPPHVHSFY